MRLGVFGEWDKPYLTMAFDYEARIAEAFLAFLGGGYVYRGRKAVYWCISCKTALAEAEVEYENDRSPSIYVRYPVTSDPAALDPALAGRKLWVIIWTTTPWTLPASMAVAFHPDFEYVVVGDDDPHGDAYIMESRRMGPVLEATGLNAPNILARVPAKALEKIEVRHPFLDRVIVPVMANYVTAEDGTGIVHTAPGHGREDYMTGVQYGIEIYCPVDEAGKITEGLPEYVGKRVFDANAPIIELAEGARRVDGAGGHAGALLSPLLALPQSHHLPRGGAVVHQYGSQGTAPARFGRNQEDPLGSLVGGRAHFQHDRRAPRLVHLPPARLGRAAHRVPLRGLQEAHHGRGTGPARH